MPSDEGVVDAFQGGPCNTIIRMRDNARMAVALASADYSISPGQWYTVKRYTPPGQGQHGGQLSPGGGGGGGGEGEVELLPFVRLENRSVKSHEPMTIAAGALYMVSRLHGGRFQRTAKSIGDAAGVAPGTIIAAFRDLRCHVHSLIMQYPGFDPDRYVLKTLTTGPDGDD
jgi:hypothetical protein